MKNYFPTRLWELKLMFFSFSMLLDTFVDIFRSFSNVLHNNEPDGDPRLIVIDLLQNLSLVPVTSTSFKRKTKQKGLTRMIGMNAIFV